jgi:glycerol-3-phosphate dehydrogenase (NAD(P)+)
MRITTIGDGAMATVSSMLLASKGHTVTMWVRLPADLVAIRTQRENTRYLPGYRLPENLQGTSDDAAAFAGCELILMAAPTQFIRPTLTRLAPHIAAAAGRQVPIVSVAKGIENGTLLRPTQIVCALLGERPVAALSGPNIAAELARQLPATAVAATPDAELGKRVQDLFATPYLRVYRNKDLLGVELAGALKNVIAVAAGILDGMHAGNNAKAALLTRGLVEISRLGVALGAQAETFAGLAGLGDLVTTCVSPEGRNRTFGERVGRGEKPEAVLASMTGVVEGVATCQSVVQLAQQLKVEMPISAGLYRVLFEGLNPLEGIAELMAREPKHEGLGA